MKIALPYAVTNNNALTRFFRLLLARAWASHKPRVDNTAEKPCYEVLTDEMERMLVAREARRMLYRGR